MWFLINFNSNVENSCIRKCVANISAYKLSISVYTIGLHWTLHKFSCWYVFVKWENWAVKWPMFWKNTCLHRLYLCDYLKQFLGNLRNLRDSHAALAFGSSETSDGPSSVTRIISECESALTVLNRDLGILSASIAREQGEKMNIWWNMKNWLLILILLILRTCA